MPVARVFLEAREHLIWGYAANGMNGSMLWRMCTFNSYPDNQCASRFAQRWCHDNSCSHLLFQFGILTYLRYRDDVFIACPSRVCLSRGTQVSLCIACHCMLSVPEQLLTAPVAPIACRSDFVAVTSGARSIARVGERRRILALHCCDSALPTESGAGEV